MYHFSLTYFVRGANNFHVFHLTGLVPGTATSGSLCLDFLLLLDLRFNQRSGTYLIRTSRYKQISRYSNDKSTGT